MLSKLSKTIILTIIFILIIIHAALSPMDKEAMRRESNRPTPIQGEIVLSLDQALNLSLAYGDYRKVDVNWAEVGV